jgi:CheY-like chemotaxis protein
MCTPSQAECGNKRPQRNFRHNERVRLYGTGRYSYDEAGMQRQTILIVDDTPDHRGILRRLLDAVGYRVVEAASGDDAIDQACAELPDLILMALKPPGHPGWEAARTLASQPALRHTPILGTTIYNTLMTAPRVRALGCADFVDKPFDLDELLLRIGALLPNAPRSVLAA